MLEDDQGRFAFVAVKGTIERRDVTTGRFTPLGLTITTGLKPGDLVVIAGLHFVEPGMKVRVLAE